MSTELSFTFKFTRNPGSTAGLDVRAWIDTDGNGTLDFSSERVRLENKELTWTGAAETSLPTANMLFLVKFRAADGAKYSVEVKAGDQTVLKLNRTADRVENVLAGRFAP